MLRQLTIYLPNQLAGVTAQIIKQYPALTTLLQNANVFPPAANEIELMLAQLAIAKAVANEQGILLNQSCLIAQPVKIRLDQTQGYLQPISQIPTEVIASLNIFLQQQWVEQMQKIQWLDQHHCWLIWPKQTVTPVQLFRPQASAGMAINAFLPRANAHSVGIWFNESQMLLHQFNQNHATPINALWLWGNGTIQSIEYDCIISVDNFIASFAKANSIACYKVLEPSMLQQYKHILYMAEDNNLATLEQEVFALSLRALKNKTLTQVKLEAPPFYQFICQATTFKKWWQKKTTLEQILHDNR